ncbi:MAG: hypothetical protein IKP06_05510 [Elusimicrobiaceae bacterium]|nr:hypothetical protein [Elusimicrobiaceae bacterium]
MGFLFTKSKKNLDITDALKRKEATLTIQGKQVTIKAFKLAEALELFAALGNMQELLRLIGTDITLFNRVLLAKLPVVLRFCVPDGQIDPDKITLAEFADLVLAVYCVNDLERILANFTQAMSSMPKTTQVLASLPK